MLARDQRTQTDKDIRSGRSQGILVESGIENPARAGCDPSGLSAKERRLTAATSESAEPAVPASSESGQGSVSDPPGGATAGLEGLDSTATLPGESTRAVESSTRGMPAEAAAGNPVPAISAQVTMMKVPRAATTPRTMSSRLEGTMKPEPS
ncbi:hypothetical protein GCM10009766_03560 [Microcella frigidaquae]